MKECTHHFFYYDNITDYCNTYFSYECCFSYAVLSSAITNNTDINIYRYDTPLIPLLPITVTITLVVIIFTTSEQIVNGSLNETMGIGISNTTLSEPEIDNDYENDNKDMNTNTKTQNCQMPPCPPGEMCIQVCPESVP